MIFKIGLSFTYEEENLLSSKFTDMSGNYYKNKKADDLRIRGRLNGTNSSLL
jgi:hypothetical protein